MRDLKAGGCSNRQISKIIGKSAGYLNCIKRQRPDLYKQLQQPADYKLGVDGEYQMPEEKPERISKQKQFWLENLPKTKAMMVRGIPKVKISQALGKSANYISSVTRQQPEWWSMLPDELIEKYTPGYFDKDDS